MQPTGFNEALDAVLNEDPRYDRAAYVFLRDALEATAKSRRKARKGPKNAPQQHVTPTELLDGFRVRALKEFGPMAKLVLGSWGIQNCEDVGNMVFNLVRAQIFGKTDDDRIEDFRCGFDFGEAFLAPFRPAQKRLSDSAGVVVPTSQ